MLQIGNFVSLYHWNTGVFLFIFFFRYKRLKALEPPIWNLILGSISVWLFLLGQPIKALYQTYESTSMRMRAWAWIMTENKNVKSRKLPATNQTPANRLPPRSFLVFAFNYLVHVKTFSVSITLCMLKHFLCVSFIF